MVRSYFECKKMVCYYIREEMHMLPWRSCRISLKEIQILITRWESIRRTELIGNILQHSWPCTLTTQVRVPSSLNFGAYFLVLNENCLFLLGWISFYITAALKKQIHCKR
jgi:hypothetical protein